MGKNSEALEEKAGYYGQRIALKAQNKQDFLIVLNGEKVKIEFKDSKYCKINLGIIKYHFENSSEQSL